MPILGQVGLWRRRGLTVGSLTTVLARVYGARPAFSLVAPSRVAGSAEITYRDLEDAVARLASALGRRGVGSREAVALLVSNGCDLLLSFLALIRAGATAFPLNPVLKPPEIRALVDASGARTILVDPPTLDALGEVPDVDRVLSLGRATGAADVLASARRIATPGPPAPALPTDVVAVLATSGTTGRPKGARVTSAGLLSVGRIGAGLTAAFPGVLRRGMSALPVAHAMGLGTAFFLLMAGITHRMLPRFEAAVVLEELERYRPDTFIGVPAMYRALLEAGAEDRDLRCIRVWASAADYTPAGLAHRFQRMGRFLRLPAAFAEAYGMAELAGAVLCRVFPPHPMLDRPPAVVLPPHRIRISDREGRAVPRGNVGELWVRGPGVMAGYVGEEPAASPIRGGWMRTGDLARAGPAGTVFLEGRAKDVIKVGGYSVHPVEVEDEVRAHPRVGDVVVVAAADERLGQVPVAAVEPESGGSLEVGDLERWAKEAVAAYRRPRRWLIVDRLPRGPTGKADREAVARRLV